MGKPRNGAGSRAGFVAAAFAVVVVQAAAGASATTLPPSPTPTPTPDLFCPPDVQSSPPAGLPGTIVDLRGRCYLIHSGGRADVFLDDRRVGGVGGETGGDYRTLLPIPTDSPPGKHVIRVVAPGPREIGSGEFVVTRAPGDCVGDCNEDGGVAINELLALVRIFLGELPSQACPALGDESLSLARLTLAVRNALRGCPPGKPALESFTGSYEVVLGEAASIELPGPVWFSEGTAAVDGDELSLEIEYFPGTLRVGGTAAADGSVALNGTFDIDAGGGVYPAAGAAIAQERAGDRWITGEVTFQRFEATPPVTLSFSMRQSP